MRDPSHTSAPNDLNDDAASSLTETDRSQDVALRAERLRSAVRAAGGNQAVAERANMHVGTLNRYIAGRDMKASALITLADACNVDIEWLAVGASPNSRALSADELKGDDLEGQRYVIPRYDIKASAGFGAEVVEEEVVAYIALSGTWLRSILGRINATDLAIINASGDSMEPTINDHNTIVIDTSQRTIKDGRIYVINVDGNVLVKRIQIRTDGYLLIKSDNPHYDTEMLAPSELQRLRIIGKVVWQGGPLPT